jgi:hypothetical protein
MQEGSASLTNVRFAFTDGEENIRREEKREADSQGIATYGGKFWLL